MERTKVMTTEILGRLGKLGKYRKVIEKEKKRVRIRRMLTV